MDNNEKEKVVKDVTAAETTTPVKETEEINNFPWTQEVIEGEYVDKVIVNVYEKVKDKPNG